MGATARRTTQLTNQLADMGCGWWKKNVVETPTYNDVDNCNRKDPTWNTMPENDKRKWYAQQLNIVITDPNGGHTRWKYNGKQTRSQGGQRKKARGHGKRRDDQTKNKNIKKR